MTPKELALLTDEELLKEAKKVRSDKIITAALIGFLAGIIVYSVVKKSFGFLMLIPIIFAYKLINKPKYNSKELEELLKERGLK